MHFHLPSHSRYTGVHLIILPMTCDNRFEELLTREVYPSLGIQNFYWVGSQSCKHGMHT